MDLLKAYRENPCGTLSIPYWKNKRISVPPHMKIVHDNIYLKCDYTDYVDEPYFRLYHTLEEIPETDVDDIRISTAKSTDIPAMVDVINRAYSDLSVTFEQLMGYTKTEVFDPDLWVIAVDEKDSGIVGCGIADFDIDLREGILEWIQVLPDERGKGIGRLIVCELLKRMKGKADFATVSGKINNETSPEKLYRKCGFAGNDVWHVLTCNDVLAMV